MTPRRALLFIAPLALGLGWAFEWALVSDVAMATGSPDDTSVSAPHQDAKKDKPQSKPAKGSENLAPLPLKLPRPAFKGTPKHIPAGTRLEAPAKGPRPPFMAPKGCTNLALDKAVSASDEEPIIGEAELITDGGKEAREGEYVEFGPGAQWVQIDLEKECTLHAIVLWHYHGSARVYHDVVIQVSNDEDFVTGVKTLFNNDHDNSAGLGVGRDKEFWETYQGKLVDAKGAKGRYVRLTSNGSTADDQNHYTEVEVFGLQK